MPGAGRKLREWVMRYGPAEIISLLFTVAGGWLASISHANNIGSALAATWCGNVGYFGTILAQDMRAAKRSLAQESRTYNRRALLRNLRALLVEFGVAEVLDSFFIRPYLLYRMPQLTGGLPAA